MPRWAAIPTALPRAGSWHGMPPCQARQPAPPSLVLAPPRQVVDYGDLSRLLRPAYEAALQSALAAAEPFELSYRRDAPKPQPGKTYLMPYVIERYTRIALKLKLWPYPRGHHQHVAIIPWE